MQSVMRNRLLSYVRKVSLRWILLCYSLNAYQKNYHKQKTAPLKTLSQTTGTSSMEYRQLVTSEDDKRSETKEATARNNKSERDILEILRCWYHWATFLLCNCSTRSPLEIRLFDRNVTFKGFLQSTRTGNWNFTQRWTASPGALGDLTEWTEETSDAEDMSG